MKATPTIIHGRGWTGRQCTTTLSYSQPLRRQAYEKGIEVKGQHMHQSRYEQIRYTAERDDILDDFRRLGALIMTNACGPCIGQWKRHTDDNSRKNAIVTSFNRNFHRPC